MPGHGIYACNPEVTIIYLGPYNLPALNFVNFERVNTVLLEFLYELHPVLWRYQSLKLQSSPRFVICGPGVGRVTWTT